MYIKPYECKGYVFEINYNSKDALYTARCGSMYTYDTDLEGIKNKIANVVHQNTEFKLSVDDCPLDTKGEY